MIALTGFAELEITLLDHEEKDKTPEEDVEEIRSVEASEFGLEEGEGWHIDPDDGERVGEFLYIAYCDGFDLELELKVRGNTTTYHSLAINKHDLLKFNTKDVRVINDTLEFNCIPD